MAVFIKNNYLEKLPAELKLRIMQNLSQKDLCNVVLVSKNIKTAALDPSLWTELTVNRKFMEKLIKEDPQMLAIRSTRFNNIKSLKIETNALATNALFKMSKELISQFQKSLFLKVENLDLSGPFLAQNLADGQIETFFTETINFNSLSELNLSQNELDEVPTKLLVKAISKLKKVNLFDTNLLTEQLEAIMNETDNSNSLVELDLGSNNNMDDISTDILAKPFSKLKKIGLCGIDLSTEQLVAVFEETIKSKTLIDLNLSYNYCSFDGVPAKLISKAISKLKTVNLSGIDLKPKQLVAVLEETAKSRTLVELNLGNHNLHEDVPKELLAKAISKLEKVELYYARLSTEQLVAILEETVKSNSLIELNLGNNDLKDVPKELLTEATSTLKKIDLSSSKLNFEQTTAICEAVLNSSSLMELNLSYTSSLKDVPPNLLVKMISKLKKVDLSGSKLSIEQLVAILDKTAKSNSLMELSFHKFDLEGVPDELLTKAKNKLNINDEDD